MIGEIIPRMTEAMHAVSVKLYARHGAVKAIDSVREEYERKLDGIYKQARAGVERDELERQIRDALAVIALLLLIRGLRDGGVDYEALEPEDRVDVDLIMTAWVAGQAAYAAGFAEALDELDTLQAGVNEATTESEREAAQAALDTATAAVETRMELWTASGGELYLAAYANANSDKMGTWVYGPTEHCQTCQNLNGKRRRLSWYIENGFIPRKPGAAMDCEGFRCLCEIVDSNGVRLL